jgi:hypothetical protein
MAISLEDEGERLYADYAERLRAQDADSAATLTAMGATK